MLGLHPSASIFLPAGRSAHFGRPRPRRAAPSAPRLLPAPRQRRAPTRLIAPLGGRARCGARRAGGTQHGHGAGGGQSSGQRGWEPGTERSDPRKRPKRCGTPPGAGDAPRGRRTGTKSGACRAGRGRATPEGRPAGSGLPVAARAAPYGHGTGAGSARGGGGDGKRRSRERCPGPQLPSPRSCGGVTARGRGAQRLRRGGRRGTAQKLSGRLRGERPAVLRGLCCSRSPAGFTPALLPLFRDIRSPTPEAVALPAQLRRRVLCAVGPKRKPSLRGCVPLLLLLRTFQGPCFSGGLSEPHASPRDAPGAAIPAHVRTDNSTGPNPGRCPGLLHAAPSPGISGRPRSAGPRCGCGCTAGVAAPRSAAALGRAERSSGHPLCPAHICSLRCGGAALEAKPQVKKAQPRVPVSLSSGRSQLRINYIIPRWRPLLGYSNRSLSSAYCGVSPEPGIFELGAAQKVG